MKDVASSVAREWRPSIRIFAFLAALPTISACAPNWYEGEFAVLIPNEATTVVKAERDLGDCYRVFSELPTTYEIARSDYTLAVVHSDRYWPQFHLAARSSDGSPLEIIGPKIWDVDYLWSMDHEKVEARSGYTINHQTIRLDYFEEDQISVAILDKQWNVLGIEELRYETISVNCFGWDGV